MATIAQHGARVTKAVYSASRSAINNPGISQDNIIFAVVIFAFIVWITTKGELKTYLSFFTPGATQAPPTIPVTASSTTGGGAASAAAGTVANAPAQASGILSGTVSG